MRRRTSIGGLAGMVRGWGLPFAVQAATGGPYEIKSVIISGQGAHVEVSPNPPPSTYNWSGTQFVVQRGPAHYQDMLSTLLAAHMANRPVLMWWTPEGAGDCGFMSQLRIDAVQVKK